MSTEMGAGYGSFDSETISERIRARARRAALLLQGHMEREPFSLPDDLTAQQALDVTLEELHATNNEYKNQNAELLRTRNLLEAERQRYADLFQLAPVAYLVTDVSGLILEANLAAVKLIAKEPRFLIGSPLSMYIAPADKRQFRRRLALLVVTNRRGEMELTFSNRRRGVFTAEAIASVECDLDGRPALIRWILHDVTERNELEEERKRYAHQLENRLQQSGHELKHVQDHAHVADCRLRDLLDTIDAIVWEADACTGRFNFVSRHAETLLGYPVEKWLTEPEFWSNHLFPADREWAKATRAKAFEQRNLHEFEYRMIAADGRVLWFRDSVTFVTDAQACPSQLRGVMWNITKRKKTEKQLYTAKRDLTQRLIDMTCLQEFSGRLSTKLELPSILEEVLAAVTSLQKTDLGILLIYDPEQELLVPAASTGFSQEYLDRYARIPLGGGASGLAATRRTRVVVEDVSRHPEYEGLQEMAEAGEFQGVFSTPLLDHGGELLGVIATYFREPYGPLPSQIRLVEMYARQAEHFIESARLLDESQLAVRHKDQFLAELAHELRNPLAPILNSVAIARGTDDPAGQEAALDTIERQVCLMARLLEDLLDAARVNQGKIQLRKVRVDVRDVVSQAIETSRPLIEAHGHTLQVALPDDRIEVEADPARLVQVLANLLNNASKYTPEPGGRIDLAAELEGDKVVFRIRDTGMGIEPEMLERVFDLFTQVNRSAAHREGGLGIGLTLVRRLVEMHGGTVTAWSAGAGEGSEFVVTMPVAGPQDRAGSSSDQVDLGPSERRRVLVVDDHELTARLLARLLRLEGHVVWVAHDGVTALELAQEHRPDVALLDIAMPGMSGYDVALRLRALERSQPLLLVAMTGDAHAQVRLQTEDLVFDSHVIKPVDPKLLHELLAAPSACE